MFVEYPMDFETLWGEAPEARLARPGIRIAALEHFIQMKQSVGRPQDGADIEVLKDIQQLLAEEATGTNGGNPDTEGARDV